MAVFEPIDGETLFVDGQWCSATTGDTYESKNPATGKRLGVVAAASAEDARRAVYAAQNAAADWAQRTVYERSAVLYSAYHLMREHADDLARIMTSEQGKPLRAARNEVGYAADFLMWYAEECKRMYGATIPSARLDQRFIVMRQPIGVVAAITPWNYPMSMITRKVAPALAAGCTVVLKPAEQTPLCAVAVFGLLEEAGVPPGVANLLTAERPGPIGKELLNDSNVRKLTFTGSTAVGKELAALSARTVKRVSLELGGHAPFIVFPDADPIHAARGASLVKFLNTGQACISPNRIYVHRSIEEPFVAALSQRMQSMKVGSGLSPEVTIGPLIDAAALAKMERHVQNAVDHGAHVRVGGRRLTGGVYETGYFFAPTLLTGVTPEMQIYREETFGPIAPVIAFDDEEEVLAMANDTNYGLASYVYTRSLTTAWRMAEGLNTAIVGINDINPTSAAAPFGGMKESGLGREGGNEGLAEYLETKLVGLAV